jgi:chromosome segregation ATPase
MCKKLFLAAVAIVIGVFVVRYTQLGTLLQVWWHDARASAEKWIPPEQQIKTLNMEVEKIGTDIRQNISKLAKQEADCEKLEKDVVALRATQKQLREEIASIEKVLDARTERVVFQGAPYRPSELARRLDSATVRYTNGKGELKAKEQLLEERKKTLEEAHRCISKMRDEKERLRVEVARLETSLETLKLQQMQDRVQLDETQVGKCNELLAKIQDRLRQMEIESKLQRDFGVTNTAVVSGDTKSTEEVLKAARKVLQDDNDAVATDKK